MNHAEKGHCVIYMDILEHLQELYPTLTKKQKTIADFMKDPFSFGGFA